METRTESPDRWAEVKAILLAALEVDVTERPRLLELRCGDDAELRAEVEGYLARESEALRLIPTPAFKLMAPPPPEGREGSELGPFRLESEIGRGGMGVVYRARRRTPFDQVVAIKVLKRGLDTEEILARFDRERRILSRLEHPAIVQILDGGSTDDGLPYLVMDLVEGTPIDRFCRDRGLCLASRLRLFAETCEAVHHAHQNLVVHRDLKPANLLVDRSGRPRLLDFGIAKLLDEDFGGTRTTERPMTPVWASPEQREGSLVTTGFDVYTLGMLLELLMTDLPPVSSRGAFGLTSSTPIPAPVPPSKRMMTAARGAEDAASRQELARRARRLRGDLDRIVGRARHADPERRYASAADLARDVRCFLEGRPVTARPDSFPYRLRLLAKRQPWAAAGLVLAALAVISFTVTVSVLLSRVSAERNRVEEALVVIFDVLDATDPGHPDRSREAQRAMIETTVRRLAELPPQDWAPLANRIAQSLMRDKQHELAIEVLRPAVAIYETTPSLSRYGFADVLNNLGKTLIDKRQNEEGIALIERALETLSSVEGEYPRTRLEYFTNLAYGLEYADPDRATAIYRQVRDERRARFGSQDISVGNAANNLGMFLHRRGRFQEAIPLLDEAVRIRRQRRGGDHPSVAISHSNRAAARHEVGDLDGAVDDARAAFRIRSHLGLGPRELVVSRLRLADVLLSRGTVEDLAEASVHLAQAQESTAPESATRVVVDRHRAYLLTLDGDAARSAALSRDALERSRDAFDDAPWRVADLESVHGGALLAAGRRSEGRAALERSWAALCDDPRSRISARRQAAARLRQLRPPLVVDESTCRSPG